MNDMPRDLVLESEDLMQAILKAKEVLVFGQEVQLFDEEGNKFSCRNRDDLLEMVNSPYLPPQVRRRITVWTNFRGEMANQRNQQHRWQAIHTWSFHNESRDTTHPDNVMER